MDHSSRSQNEKHSFFGYIFQHVKYSKSQERATSNVHPTFTQYTVLVVSAT